MDKFVLGICAAVAAVALLGLGFNMGRNTVVNDCTYYGKSRVDGVTLECRRTGE